MSHRGAISVLVVALALHITVRTISQQTDIVKIDTNKVVFNADWHQNVQDLQQKIQAFNNGLTQQGLQSIDISLAYCSDYQYILDNIFQQPLRGKSVTINLDSCPIGDKGLLHILTRIDGKVEELSLGLGSAGITEGIAKDLGQKLGSLPLRKLELNLLFVQLGDKGINELFLHPLSQHLQELRLDLTYNTLKPQSLANFKHFLSLVQPSTLKKASLLLNSNKVEEKGCQYLSSALSRFDQLESLTIDLYFNNIKAKGARHISDIVKGQKQLKHLAINFDLNYIQTEGGKAIAEAIQTQSHLRYLELGVSNKNFGYNGFQHITAALRHLPLIEDLTLRAGVNRIGLKGAERLAEALEKVSLIRLNLGLSESFLTDEGVELIGRLVEKQKELRSVKLNLGFNEARGYGPISVLKVLEKKEWQEVSLSLTSNPLQDKEVKLMLPILQAILKKNKNLDFQLLETKISEAMANELRGIFKDREYSLHVNSNEESTKIREELEQQNNPGQKSEVIDL